MDLLYNMVGSDPRKVHSMSFMYSIDSMYSRDSVDSVCVDSVDYV